jgi:hypothetical protein
MDLRKWWPHADSGTVGQFPLSHIMRAPFRDYDLAPLQKAVPSLADRFGIRRGRLLFHFGRCTLRTFATETKGKLASVICVDVGVVLSP